MNPRLIVLCVALSLSACDRPEPIDPVAGTGSSAGNAATPPVTDPATAPAPAGSMPTAPTPAGTLPTDPPAPLPAGTPPVAATATVTLQAASGSQVSGIIDLMPHDGGVHLSGRIAGLTPGSQHGFHVHETGDCSAPDASSAGGHFNPAGAPHGAAGSPAHHAGDLPSAAPDTQGEASIDLMVNGLEIGTGGPRDVIGRALVVHQQADDYTTQPDGAAGARIGCGVIVRR